MNQNVTNQMPCPASEPDERGMSDEALSELISRTLERQQMLAELQQVIVQDVEKRVRRQRIRRVARVLAFSFGLPTVLLVVGLGMYHYISHVGLTTLSAAALLFATLTMLYAAREALRNFSPDEV